MMSAVPVFHLSIEYQQNNNDAIIDFACHPDDG